MAFSETMIGRNYRSSRSISVLKARIFDIRVRRLYGKRRPGIGKRQQYAYLKLGNTRIRWTKTSFRGNQ